MKRYDLALLSLAMGIEESETGEWVKWEDVESWMLQLRKEIEDDEKWWNPEESWIPKLTKDAIEKVLRNEPAKD